VPVGFKWIVGRFVYYHDLPNRGCRRPGVRVAHKLLIGREICAYITARQRPAGMSLKDSQN
jgi:hypothetical protein